MLEHSPESVRAQASAEPEHLAAFRAELVILADNGRMPPGPDHGPDPHGPDPHGPDPDGEQHPKPGCLPNLPCDSQTGKPEEKHSAAGKFISEFMLAERDGSGREVPGPDHGPNPNGPDPHDEQHPSPIEPKPLKIFG